MIVAQIYFEHEARKTNLVIKLAEAFSFTSLSNIKFLSSDRNDEKKSKSKRNPKEIQIHQSSTEAKRAICKMILF